MKKYSIVYFMQQVYVEDRFPGDRPATQMIYSPQYLTGGGCYTNHIDSAILFENDGSALRAIPNKDNTTYLIQHVYKNDTKPNA